MATKWRTLRTPGPVTDDQRVNILVIILASILPSVSPTEIRKHGGNILTCTSSPTNDPYVFWQLEKKDVLQYQDGLQIETDPRIKFLCDNNGISHENLSLTIESAHFLDGGRYICHVQKDHSSEVEIVATHTLKVEGWNESIRVAQNGIVITHLYTSRPVEVYFRGKDRTEHRICTVESNTITDDENGLCHAEVENGVLILDSFRDEDAGVYILRDVESKMYISIVSVSLSNGYGTRKISEPEPSSELESHWIVFGILACVALGIVLFAVGCRLRKRRHREGQRRNGFQPVQLMKPNGISENFRDILEERRQSSDLSHALRSFNPQPYKGIPPCSSSALNRTVLESQYLSYVIQQMSAESGEPAEVIREEAAGILEEMSQNLQLGFIRFLGFALSKVFKRLFRRIHVNDEGLQRLQQAIQEYPVVLMPNHRSYTDFLVLSYILFTYDLSIPVIAAGIPLMGMKLVGEIFRRSGAFYIRRNIRADKLYCAVLSEYVRTIIRTGYAPIEFYVEGWRSRNLKSLTPKFGMMQMVVEPFFEGEVDDIRLVPISISYDRVLEESVVARELLGIPKPKESTLGLIKARKVLEEDYGTMHVCFGCPLSVRELAKGKINRKQYNLVPRDLPMRPSEDLQAFVNSTAHVVVRLQEENMVLSPWTLMATILMQNLEGVDWDSLAQQTEWLKELALGFGARLDWPAHLPCSEVMSSSLSLHRSVAHREGGRVFLVEEEPQGVGNPEEGVFRRAVTVVMCASYRNMALHVFVRPAMLAVALHTADSCRREDIFICFRFLQEVFSNEFIFIPGRGGEDFDEACSLLKKCGALQIVDQDITVTEQGHTTISFLRAILEPFIEAYQVVFRHLCDKSTMVFTEAEYISMVRSHAFELILSGAIVHYDILSSYTLKNALTTLVRLEAVTKSKRAEQTEFSVNKVALNRIGDTLAGRTPPQTASYSTLA